MSKIIHALKRAAFALLVCLVGCATVPPAPTPTPTSYTCETYCAHAVSMGCDFAQDTAAGAGCVAVCQNVQDKLVKWDLACRSTAETCSRINSCER